jgi:hypothetical protein
MKKLNNIINGLASSATNLAKHIAYDAERQLTPTNPRHHDIYLVSFPKSGSTWLNFIIANVNMLMSRDNRKVTFFNVHQYVPDIHDCKFIHKPLLVWPGFNFIKSHSHYNRFYPNVIYIVRNPADVMLSYYKFKSGLGVYSEPLSDFVRSPKNGIKNWIQHVSGWFLNSPPSLPFYLVKYEKLKHEPFKVIKDLYMQLGFELDDEIIHEALTKSSFSNMKELEKSLNYGGRPISQKFTFMRKGIIGDSVNHFQSTDIEYINKVSFDVQKKLEYL